MCLQQDLKWLSRRLTFPFLPWDTYCSQVRIRVLWVQTAVVLDVLESLVHQTAVAALIAFGSRTVHKVLLAQRHQFTSLPEVLTLQGSGGAEGPARATLTLKERERETVEICVKTDEEIKGFNFCFLNFRIIFWFDFTFKFHWLHHTPKKCIYNIKSWLCRLTCHL